MGKGGRNAPIPGPPRRAPPVPALVVNPPPPQPPPPQPPPPQPAPVLNIPIDEDMEMPPGHPVFNGPVAFANWNQAVNNGQGIGIPGVNQNPPPNQPQ